MRAPVSPGYDQKLFEQARRILSRRKRVVRWRLTIGLVSVPCCASIFYFWKGPGSTLEEKLLLVVAVVAGGACGVAAMLLTTSKSLWIER